MSAKLKFPEISGHTTLIDLYTSLTTTRLRLAGADRWRCLFRVRFIDITANRSNVLPSVFKAINYQYKAVEACKVLYFKQEPSSAQRKLFDKEIRIHSVLKHANVIALRGNLIIEPNDRSYIPGAYLLMEFAHGGDLFDKIGECKYALKGHMSCHFQRQMLV